MLEIADLSVNLTPMHDSHDQDWTGVTCWVIMCMQLLWHMTDLLEMEFFMPKDFRSLFMPALHIGTSLHIMRCAKEEVEYTWNAFISRDHL